MYVFMHVDGDEGKTTCGKIPELLSRRFLFIMNKPLASVWKVPSEPMFGDRNSITAS
jgi:hypothetical protein